jgi:hypothetical protein
MEKNYLPKEFHEGASPEAWKSFARRCVLKNGATEMEMDKILTSDDILEFDQGMVLCAFLRGMSISEACSVCLVSEEVFSQWKEDSFDFRQAFICCNLIIKIQIADANRKFSAEDINHLRWVQERDKDYDKHYTKEAKGNGVVVNNLMAPTGSAVRQALEAMDDVVKIGTIIDQ